MMINRWNVLFFFGVCLSVLLGNAEEALPRNVFRNLHAGKQQTVVVYGTSLTAGGAWAKAAKDWFEEKYPRQVKFINSGGPGQNSDWGRAQLKSKVLDHKPDLVVLEFSYNDAHQKFKLPVARGAENLAFMVDELRKQNPEVSIVLQTMNVPWDAPGDRLPASNRPQLEAFNENYRTFAREQKLPLVDHYQAWKKLHDEQPAIYHEWLPDGSHPNTKASLAVTWAGLHELFEKTIAAKP